jgi:hypothetical protein
MPLKISLQVPCNSAANSAAGALDNTRKPLKAVETFAMEALAEGFSEEFPLLQRNSRGFDL